MSVNPLPQKLSVASAFQRAAQALADCYAVSAKADQVFTKAGLSYGAGDFDNSAFQYFDPTTFATLITQLRTFRGFVDSGDFDKVIAFVTGGQ